MEFPDFGDFLNSISEADSESFSEAFSSAFQESNSLPEAQAALTLRMLSAYHEWLSKSLLK